MKIKVTPKGQRTGKLEEAWIHDNSVELAIPALDFLSLGILPDGDMCAKSTANLGFMVQPNQILTDMELVYNIFFFASKVKKLCYMLFSGKHVV